MPEPMALQKKDPDRVSYLSVARCSLTRALWLCMCSRKRGDMIEEREKQLKHNKRRVGRAGSQQPRGRFGTETLKTNAPSDRKSPGLKNLKPQALNPKPGKPLQGSQHWSNSNWRLVLRRFTIGLKIRVQGFGRRGLGGSGF